MSRTSEIVLGSAVAAFGALLLLVVLPHEVRVSASEVNEISPAFFPRIVSGMILAIGVVHVLVAILGQLVSGGQQPLISGMAVLRAGSVFAIGAAYIVLLPGIGFVAATATALVALTLLFGNRPLWQAAAMGVPLAFGLSYLFGELLKTPLPRAGWLE